jgi:NAD(P)H-hydrate repair Nnr-like enzyme with NAD(P)H-hydrate dehydratase domain
MIAGMLAQHPPKQKSQIWKSAVVAAVWLHGRCGELAGKALGEQATLATDLLDYLPEAMHELRPAV